MAPVNVKTVGIQVPSRLNLLLATYRLFSANALNYQYQRTMGAHGSNDESLREKQDSLYLYHRLSDA